MPGSAGHLQLVFRAETTRFLAGPALLIHRFVDSRSGTGFVSYCGSACTSLICAIGRLLDRKLAAEFRGELINQPLTREAAEVQI